MKSLLDKCILKNRLYQGNYNESMCANGPNICMTKEVIHSVCLLAGHTRSF